MAMQKRTVLGIAVVLVGILAAACGGGSSNSSNGMTIIEDGLASVPSGSGDLADDFTLPLYNGSEHFDGSNEVTLSALRGRPVIINFWAPLCPPCRAEMPDFQELWEELQAEGSDVMVLGVDLGPFTGLGDREQAIDFLETIDLTYPTGQAVDAGIVRDYKVFGMPTTVFVNRDGAVMRSWTGAITGDKLRELAAELVG